MLSKVIEDILAYFILCNASPCVF